MAATTARRARPPQRARRPAQRAQRRPRRPPLPPPSRPRRPTSASPRPRSTSASSPTSTRRSSPGLSQPLVSAVKAWGDQVNANGGLAGRKVVVTFYDSKLNPDEAVNAYTQACQNEFATVGSGAFVLLNPDPIQTCKDKSGNAIGLPDVAALDDQRRARRRRSRRFGIIQAGQDFTAARADVHRHRVRLAVLLRQDRWRCGDEPARHRPGVPGHRSGHPRRRPSADRGGRHVRRQGRLPRRRAAVRGDTDHPEDPDRRRHLGREHVDRGGQAHGRSACAGPRHDEGPLELHVAVPDAVVRVAERRGDRRALRVAAAHAVRRDRRRRAWSSTAKVSPTSRTSRPTVRLRTRRRWRSKTSSAASSTKDGVNGLTRQSLLDLLDTRPDGRPEGHPRRGRGARPALAVLGHGAGAERQVRPRRSRGRRQVQLRPERHRAR